MPLLISVIVTLATLPVLAQAPVRINPGDTGKTKTVFRETQAGETRVEGLLRRVECPPGRPVKFTMRVNDKPEQYEAARLSDVDFATYTPTFKGPLACGGRAAGDRVFLTWKATGNTRTVVAVEFLGK